jgi:hypothetical protein
MTSGPDPAVVETSDHRRLQSLLQKHHYLGRGKPVGQRMLSAAIDLSGRWLAVLIFCAAAKHLKHRDDWIGWTRAQRDRRLSLVANNSRFLILPEAHQPNLGSRVLRLTLARLGADRQARYGHPILVVETFVDPEQFQTTPSPPRWRGRSGRGKDGKMRKLGRSPI